MALVFCDSFDHYTNPSQKWDLVGVSGIYPQIQSASVRTGAQALEIANALGRAPVFVQKNIPTQATYFLGFALNVINNSIQIPICEFLDSSQTQVCLFLDSGGHFQFYRGSISAGYVLLGSPSSQALPFGCFHYIEVKVAIDHISGQCQLNVDGTVWLTLADQDTQYTANPLIGAITISSWDLGFDANNFQAFVDDVYICDDSGTSCNTFLGNIQILCGMPDANGTANTWTRGGTNLGTNYKQVYEIPPDDDTTYLEDVAATYIQAACYSGTTAAAEPVIPFVPPSSYADGQGFFPVDPNTGSPWGTSALTAAQFGVISSDGSIDRYLFPILPTTVIIAAAVNMRAKNA